MKKSASIQKEIKNPKYKNWMPSKDNDTHCKRLKEISTSSLANPHKKKVYCGC